jgi:hypothetical protein
MSKKPNAEQDQATQQAAEQAPRKPLEAPPARATTSKAKGRATSKSKAKSAQKQKADEPRTMSDQLGSARTRYTKTKSASGGASMNNGDEVATLLANLKPAEAVELAERVLELGAGTLVKRYGHLNPGQRRMNALRRVLRFTHVVSGNLSVPLLGL